MTTPKPPQPQEFTAEDSKPTRLISNQVAHAPGQRRPYLVAISGRLLGRSIPVEGELFVGSGGDVVLQIADDPSIAARHAKLVLLSDGADVGLVIKDLGTPGGTFVEDERVDRRIAQEGQRIRFGDTAVFKFTLLDEVEEQSQELLLDSSLRDPSTGVFNRRYFMERAAAELKFAQRHGAALGILLVDVDNMRDVNGQVGHAAGDEVLRGLGERLTVELRTDDVCARYDGDTFAILVGGPSVSAEQLATRLVSKIGALPFVTSRGAVGITVSIGVALFPLAEKVDDPGIAMFQAAEAALDRAQRGGRNRFSR